MEISNMRRFLPYAAAALIIIGLGLLVCSAVIHIHNIRTSSGMEGSGNAGKDDFPEDNGAQSASDGGLFKVVVDVNDIPALYENSASQNNGAAQNNDTSQGHDTAQDTDSNGNEEPSDPQPSGSEPAFVPYRDPDHIVNTDTTLYTYEMMKTDLYYLTAAHPDIMELRTLGTTEDGRELYVVLFGNRKADRQIFICAATHAREYMTTQLVMKQMEFYAAHYHDQSYNGVPLSEIFGRTCFVVMPMVNPDGVSISQLGEQGIRRQDLLDNVRAIYASDTARGYTSLDYASYLVRWKANVLGTDINRNFSPGWESVNEHPVPSADHYKGAAPGDQIETAAQMQIMRELSNPILAVSYHSYGNLVYYQYGQQGDLYTRNQQLAQHISNMTGYTLAGYSNEAGFANWCVHVRGIPAVVVETGSTAAPLPLSQFADLWGRHQWMWAMLGTVY